MKRIKTLLEVLSEEGLLEARDAMTPVDPELDALPRETNPTLTLPGAAAPVQTDQDDGDESDYAFWMHEGLTPYRSRDYGYDVFSQVDDGWMQQQMIDPDRLWPSTANEVAGAIGGAKRLDEPNKGVMPFVPGSADDLEESAEYEWELEEGADAPTGAMVALYPHPDVAEKLAVKGGEDPTALHYTLAFCGKAKDIEDPEGLANTVKHWAARTPPLDGEISGQGLFTAGPEPVTYSSPDLPQLPAARADLIDSLKSQGHPVNEDHTHSPHITLAYGDKTDEIPDHGGLPLHFTHASVVIAGDRQDFKLGGKLQEADSSADTPPVDANPPGDPSAPDDEQVDSSMSEQEIRDAGLRIDLPAESPDAKPITYKATGQQEWTPPPGWRVGLPTIDPDLAADLGVPTDLGVPAEPGSDDSGDAS